jgi:hypothetical protein
MPLTLADFLARDADLARLRQAISAGTCDDRRPLHAERDLVELLTRRWNQGREGWLTAAEGDRLAVGLTAEAEGLGILATATAEDLSDGRWYLRFRGGRRGEQLLRLQMTGPVAARREWAAYLETCARRRVWLVGGVR